MKCHLYRQVRLSQYRFKAGSFSEDARGRWYFNVTVEVETEIPSGQDRIGIDLGLKDTATCSDGTKLEAGRFYRDLEDKLAVAQRARNKKRVKAIHAKIANRRKDALHKFSRALVNRQLLKLILSRRVRRLVLIQKDRLLRFGAEIIFSLCRHCQVEVVILDQVEAGFEQTLAQDVIELMTVFSARLYGSRSHKNRRALQ